MAKQRSRICSCGKAKAPTERYCRKCKCPICGEKKENSEIIFCYGCYLAATYLPANYQQREKYAYDSTWKHQNATRTPLTGVEIMDARFPRICDLEPKKG